MNKICIFCASSPGKDPLFTQNAQEMALSIAKRNLEIVYGGGDVGIMKIIADTALQAGGKVTGVITQTLLDLEVGHKNLTKLHVVDSMSERKEMMTSLSDAFIALPGGFGTMDEIMEVITLNQIGIINKPCAFLNVNGFYDHLLQFIEHASESKLLRNKLSDNSSNHFHVANTPSQLLDLILS